MQLHSSGIQVDQQELDEILIHCSELWQESPEPLLESIAVLGDGCIQADHDDWGVGWLLFLLFILEVWF